MSTKDKKNLYLSLARSTKKDYFRMLNMKDLSNNKNFVKIFKPFFGNRGLNS